MDFKKHVIDIGTSNIADDDKVKKILFYIISKYGEASRPVKATHAKKLLLERNLIDETAAYNIHFKNISKRLDDERIDRLNNQATAVIPNEIFEKILKYKESDLSEYLAIYLLLITGLRFSELFNGVFEKKENELFIDKVSKRNDGARDLKINLLFETPDQFFKLLNKMKDSNLNNQNAFNRKVNRRLNLINLNSHKLRSIYLFYQLEVNNFDSEKPVQYRIKELLNHQSTGAGEHYHNKIRVDAFFKKAFFQKGNKNWLDYGLNCLRPLAFCLCLLPLAFIWFSFGSNIRLNYI